MDHDFLVFVGLGTQIQFSTSFYLMAVVVVQVLVSLDEMEAIDLAYLVHCHVEIELVETHLWESPMGLVALCALEVESLVAVVPVLDVVPKL